MHNYIKVFLFIFAAVFVGDIVGNVYILLNHPLVTLGTLQVDYFWLIVLLNALAISIIGAFAASFLKAEKIYLEFDVGHHMVND